MVHENKVLSDEDKCRILGENRIVLEHAVARALDRLRSDEIDPAVEAALLEESF
jgi:hypothetical protein